MVQKFIKKSPVMTQADRDVGIVWGGRQAGGVRWWWWWTGRSGGRGGVEMQEERCEREAFL